MMNSLTLIVALATIALSAAQGFPGYYYPEMPIGAPIAAPAPNYKTENFQTPYLSKSEIRDDAGQYSLSYVTANGIRVTERSFLKLAKGGDYIPVKEGTYQYISPEGVPVAYGYRADENGYVVKGYPLPVAPAPLK